MQVELAESGVKAWGVNVSSNKWGGVGKQQQFDEVRVKSNDGTVLP